jgi:arylsulfatase A-like enzyme
VGGGGGLPPAASRALTMAAAGAQQQGREAPNTRCAKNVLLITCDQWRADCLSCAGHPLVRTPNLDRLAAEGVRFANHFCQTVPCGPSRASLYCGMYQLNTRVISNAAPLATRHTNIAQELRRGGYDPVLSGYTHTITEEPASSAESEGLLPGLRSLNTDAGGDVNHLASSWVQWLRVSAS